MKELMMLSSLTMRFTVLKEEIQHSLQKFCLDLEQSGLICYLERNIMKYSDSKLADQPS